MSDQTLEDIAKENRNIPPTSAEALKVGTSDSLLTREIFSTPTEATHGFMDRWDKMWDKVDDRVVWAAAVMRITEI